MTDTIHALTERVTALLNGLATATDEMRTSEDIRHFFEFYARFHRYSFQNTLLIALHCPHATHVAGFRTWQKLGRWVKRGEHGIPILVPLFLKRKHGEGRSEDETSEETSHEAESRQRCGYGRGYVFDVSQTDGEPLPPIPEWRSLERQAELEARLIAYAETLGISVKEQVLRGTMQGYSAGGYVVRAPVAGTKTLVHEIAHELLHQRSEVRLERYICEAEAESVAYIVCRHFGFEDLHSPFYLLAHGVDGNLLKARLERITTCARLLIDAVCAGAVVHTDTTPNPMSLNCHTSAVS